jgi:YfiH family protein
MIFRELNNNLQVFKFNKLTEEKGLQHFIISRKGGISQHSYANLNLSLNVNDKKDNVIYNRKLIKSLFDTSQDKVLYPDQCHTDHIKIVTGNTTIEDLKETDALITNQKSIILGILAADCVPILLFDPVNRVIAAIHSGWKGTLKNIAGKTIESMALNFNCIPQNIFAGIGPSISCERYEVGNEVASEFRNQFGKNPDIIKKNLLTGKDHINLQLALHQQLIRKGINPENIEDSGLCTYNNSEWFFSARRDGINCGRFATVIMLV